MPPTRIMELASIIQEHTSRVDALFESQGLPTPSFDISYPATLPLSLEVQESQQAVLAASDELTTLMLGPVGSITSQSLTSWTSIQAIQRFGIANAFPTDATSTFAAIASACSIPESDVRRTLRHAMTFHIFHEPSPGVVQHTASSKALAEIPQLGQLVGFLSGEMWPSVTRLVDAMEKWSGSEEPNEAGFSIANRTDLPMFDVMRRDPERALRMAGAMDFMHTGQRYSMQHVLDHFDWGAEGLLVDVGGGRGSAAMQIARHLPGFKCIVQDLPEVIEGVEVPEDLRADGRLQFQPHDFFKEQPVKRADIYYLRWILHDWSDKYAVRILRNLVPALKKGARVLVSDLCLRPPCKISPYAERSARSFDLLMKGIQNAKERDAEDWESLFEMADARFKFQGITTPPGSTLSIICVSWAG